MFRAMTGLGIGLFAAMAVAMPAAAEDIAPASAVALVESAAMLEPGKFVWSDPATAEPVTIVISLPLQRAYVYRGKALVAATTVSTGMDGKETPVGIYPILQKNRDHRSNLYNDAPMPFMQRLTWDGIALHAGRNPGFPDSHGCIRLPISFARNLFAITNVGTTVVVTDDLVADATLDPALLQTEAERANMAMLDLPPIR
ncbi:L,D-transpeptidase family protein [Sphingomonas sp. Leaf17]|uniref:L,D-transpeptidase family protein n=1 Tax=Sphingomonas sp. Leaf17 TaxID=1735683 RepID=UPI000B0A9E4B|nr:L,D-transpeptidase family protein [Sphingomonas sp. Leaf17]